MDDVIDNLDDSIACDVHNKHMKHETDKIRPTGQKYAITPSWSKVLLLVNIVVGTLNVEPVLEPI